jgi:hypothetical protein
MEHVDFTADLQGLRESLRRLQALWAWHQLKEQEAKPGLPPSFQVYDPTATELRNEYSHFLFICRRLRAAMNQPRRAVPHSLRIKTSTELQTLELQAHRLGLSAGQGRP